MDGIRPLNPKSICLLPVNLLFSPPAITLWFAGDTRVFYFLASFNQTFFLCEIAAD